MGKMRTGSELPRPELAGSGCPAETYSHASKREMANPRKLKNCSIPHSLPQDDSQIGHSVPTDGTSINLEGTQDTDKTFIDLLLAPFGQQHR